MRPTLGQLVSVRSQLAEGIEAYYRTVLGRLDRTPWYRAGRMIPASAVAVPARVLKEVTRPERERQPGSEQEQEREEREHLPPVDREIAALYERRVLEKRQEEVSWEAERLALRRAVVLGGPGGGKTLLTQTTALALARQGLEELDGRSKPLEELPLPVWLELDTLGQAGRPRDLSEALVEMLREQHAFSAHLGRWLIEVLSRNNCWLILDALDQVKPENLARLRDRLEALESLSCKVLLTCRTANYDRARIPWADVAEYELAPFGWTEIGGLIGRWYGADDRRGRRLKAVMQRGYSLQHGCRTPLLATLACLANEGKELTAETRRGDLYGQVLRDLLRRAHRKGPLDAKDPHVDDLLEMLEPMAWELFQASPAVNQFTNAEVKEALQAGAKAAGLSEVEHPATKLRDELLADGVLVGAGLSEKNENQYSVLHRSFLEYLVARHLGRVANKKGWVNAMVTVPEDRQVPLDTLVDKKSWLAEWREVITLLAGRLEDAGPLITLLKNEKTDDMFRHRLALGAMCLGELRDRAAYRGQITEVTAVIWGLYWMHLKCQTKATVKHLEPALPVLAEVDGEIGPGQRLFLHLAGLLRDPDESALSRVAAALGQMGPAAALADVVDMLAGQLRHPDLPSRALAVETLGRLGPAAARAEVLDGLASLLRVPDRNERCSAAKALGQMGPTAARADVVEVLVGLLRHPDAWVRYRAAGALERMGPAAGRVEVVDVLVGWLLDQGDPSRFRAAEALGDLGPAAARVAVVDALVACLRDPVEEVRRWAAWALGQLGPAAARADVVDELVGVLRDPAVCFCAGYALGQMGEAGRTAVVDVVVGWTQDPDWQVRSSAAQALGQLGPAAARADVMDVLVGLLPDPVQQVRERAAQALGQLGPAAARADVVDGLVGLLRDPDAEVRNSAAVALGQLEPAAARADMVARLVGLLRDPDAEVRYSAAQALGMLGPAAAREDVVNGLVGLFRDPDWTVRLGTAAVLGRMGRAAEREDVVDGMVGLLRDRHYWVWDEFAWALGRLGPAAARADVVSWLVGLLRDPIRQVREGAGRVLAQLGPVMAGADGVNILLGLLRHPDHEVRDSATSALGRMAPAAAREDVVDGLVDLLWESEWHDRPTAAEALASIMRSGFRFFHCRTEHVPKLSVVATADLASLP